MGELRPETTELDTSDTVNVVLTIFSKQPRDYSKDLRKHIDRRSITTDPSAFLAIKDQKTFSVLDQATGTARLSISNVTTPGRVCEIPTIFMNPQYVTNPTFEDCKRLRNHPEIQQIQSDLDVELVLQPYSIYSEHKRPGLAVFDMDSTLIQQEVIDELARSVGRYEEVAKATEGAMRGEMDFEQSLRMRVEKLKGVDKAIWETLKKDVITITPGARDLVKALRNGGWKTAVLSGGFTPLANWLKDEIGLDYAFANHLALNEAGTELSGELVPGTRVIDGQAKRSILLQLAEENKIPLKRVVAVGDGSNDLPMMNEAGMGIAFNAKPKVQEVAPARLNSTSLMDVMHLLGYGKLEIDMKLKPCTTDDDIYHEKCK